MPESGPPSWLLRLLDELGYQVPPRVQPLDAYVDRYGDARYVFEVEKNGERRRVEVLEEDLHLVLYRKPKREPPRPDPLLDPELARLTPNRGEFGEVWGRSIHPVFVRAARRAELRRATSWYRKDEAPEWLRARVSEVGGEGAGAGLARRYFVDLSRLPARCEPYREAFAQALRAYPVEPELLMALVIQESGRNPKARRHEPRYQERYVTGNPRWDKARALRPWPRAGDSPRSWVPRRGRLAGTTRRTPKAGSPIRRRTSGSEPST